MSHVAEETPLTVAVPEDSYSHEAGQGLGVATAWELAHAAKPFEDERAKLLAARSRDIMIAKDAPSVSVAINGLARHVLQHKRASKNEPGFVTKPREVVDMSSKGSRVVTEKKFVKYSHIKNLEQRSVQAMNEVSSPPRE